MTSLQRALFETELNSLCNSFSSLHISPSSTFVVKAVPEPVPAPKVVLVGTVETILEEDALVGDGYEYPDQMSHVDEYVLRKKASERMMKIMAANYREDMIEQGTPFCVCVPLMGDFVPINNSKTSNDEDKEVHISEEETTTTTTTHLDDGDDVKHTDNDDDEKTIETETSTTVTTEDEERMVEEGEQDEIPTSTSTSSDDSDDKKEVIPPTVILELLVVIAQYWIVSTATFLLKLASLPLLIAAYIILKTMKMAMQWLLCDGDGDSDECSVDSMDSDMDDEVTLMTEEEVLDMLYKKYTTEEEFKKAWEFNFATITYRYVDYKFELQQQYQAELDAMEDEVTTPWWKFW